MAKTIQTTTEYLFMFSNGSTYENPNKETLQHFFDRKGITTEAEAVTILNSFKGLQYFIGTQAEYDELDYMHKYYWEVQGSPDWYYWQWMYHLKDGKTATAPTFAELVTNPLAKELTKDEYDIIKAKNDAIGALAIKLSNIRTITGPKLGAYIEKGEDFLELHASDIKSQTLATFVGANGKIQLPALEIVIKGHQDKVDSMTLITQLFYHYADLIRTGTEDSLKDLPFDTPTELNAKLDELWKIEQDKSRKELSVKLGVSMDLMNYVDTFLLVASGDESEVK